MAANQGPHTQRCHVCHGAAGGCRACGGTGKIRYVAAGTRGHDDVRAERRRLRRVERGLEDGGRDPDEVLREMDAAARREAQRRHVAVRLRMALDVLNAAGIGRIEAIETATGTRLLGAVRTNGVTTGTPVLLVVQTVESGSRWDNPFIGVAGKRARFDLDAWVRAGTTVYVLLHFEDASAGDWYVVPWHLASRLERLRGGDPEIAACAAPFRFWEGLVEWRGRR